MLGLEQSEQGLSLPCAGDRGEPLSLFPDTSLLMAILEVILSSWVDKGPRSIRGESGCSLCSASLVWLAIPQVKMWARRL